MRTLLGVFRVDGDLRCMRWPFGVLCWLDTAGNCQNRAVCRLHDKVRNVAAYVGMWRPAARDSAGSR